MDRRTARTRHEGRHRAHRPVGQRPLERPPAPAGGQIRTAGTSWPGTELSKDDDSFDPLRVEHLQSRMPEVVPYLALPPGWRFLIAPGHEDVWFDETLLRV